MQEAFTPRPTCLSPDQYGKYASEEGVMDRSVGIIGLGIMGGAIAANLVERGWRVVGHDIDETRCREARAAGIAIAPDVASVAREVPYVLTSLPSPRAVHAVAREIAASGAERCIVAEMSTLALDDKLAFATVLEAAGHVPLDCPLSGTGGQAKVRDLVVYASGDVAAIAALNAVLVDFARLTCCLGGFGGGTKMKLVANLLVAIHNVATAEAMVLASHAGLDPHQVVELIGAGAGTSRVFELRAPMMADGRYVPATMRVSTWQKDMAIIASFAEGLGCPTPLFTASGPIYDRAMAAGLGDADTASVHAVIEAMAGDPLTLGERP